MNELGLKQVFEVFLDLKKSLLLIYIVWSEYIKYFWNFPFLSKLFLPSESTWAKTSILSIFGFFKSIYLVFTIWFEYIRYFWNFPLPSKLFLPSELIWAETSIWSISGFFKKSTFSLHCISISSIFGIFLSYQNLFLHLNQHGLKQLF